MPNSKFSTSDSKINMVESKPADSKTNNSATAKHHNVDWKHNNSGVLRNNNSDAKSNNSDVKANADSKTNADASAQGDGGGTVSPHGAAQPSEIEHSLNDNKVFLLSSTNLPINYYLHGYLLIFVYKSGPLFLSSKGIGWTSWKKRWFILTQTSLVFFRSDPNAAPQKGGEVNLTLGGIDLNSSGSVVVNASKKLLTVQFPDGRDGRTFTLKAETTEDLNEWKSALDEALANAPSASPKVGSTATPKNEKGDTADGSSEQSKDRSPRTPMVLGRPILLALEDTDGTPSFLEKALRYVEDHGVKVEGILRQAADVEDVERRIREYEHGKLEFNEDEDAHVIGDCIKYVLRELPSSPVPASCCNALLDAYRTDRARRVIAMRAAICDTFPEPNRRLLQRILIMMETVAENKNVNRMSVSAVAACMAPLLLRPILACECDLGGQFNMGGDGSAQLMQAAAAANHAQAIVITLLEEYDKIFGEGDVLSDLYSDSEELGSESEELSEDDYDDDEYTSEDSEHASTSSHGEGEGDGDSYQKNTKGPSTIRSHTIAHKVTNDGEANKKLQISSHARSISQVPDNVSNRVDDHSTRRRVEHVGHSENDNVQLSTNRELIDNIHSSSTTTDSHASTKHPTSEQTDVSMNLFLWPPTFRFNSLAEDTKEESKAKTEAADLIKKKDLETRRQHLKEDVARLEEQLQKELDLRKKLETGIQISQQALFSHFSTNEMAESDVISLNQKPNDLELQSSNPEIVKDDHEETITSQESKETSSSKDMKRCSTNKPKRLNSKNEGTNSAMTKITNGLNFLKERSNYLADELQSMNRDRIKTQSQKHARRGSQDEFEVQSSMRPREGQLQHLDSHADRGRRSDDQSTNV
ncbi:hypothetical protein SSX86_011923 [Deinandra increscens subsp. villosa]|uniref:Rho GTPase activation protein n=1 Tax=Deinandra increscens subsp. villosa TaxID=3103831 RepID=A0AAP0H106_9ASTR